MTTIAEMSMGELAAYVCECLEEAGITTVLSGGSCVSIYSEGRYVSADLDLINARFASRQHICETMTKIGFMEEGRHFWHPDAEFIIEFPPGPLAVGEESVPLENTVTIQFETGVLRLLSATDCLKDRLTWFYHSKDLQCLEQAILIAQTTKVDLNEIERWSRKEKRSKEFADIKKQLSSSER